MATIDNYDFPDDLYYTNEHVWAKVEGNIITIGLSQFGQAVAGDILYVETPRVGREITKNEAFMSMESGKWVGRVKSPVNGKIVGVNADLEWESGLVNSDPYGKGWFTKIEVSSLGELDDLWRASSPDYALFIAKERIKYKK